MKARARTRIAPDVRRQLILDAAIGLIAQIGYNGLTVQALAQRCGLTNGGLLHYFGSKDLLLLAILEEHDRREAKVISAAVWTGQGDPGEVQISMAAVRNIFRAIAARSVEQPELARLLVVLQTEALHPAHPAHAYFMERDAMVLGEFASVLAGHVPQPRVVAREIVALLDGLFLQWLRAGQSFDLLEAWDHASAGVLPNDAAADDGCASSMFISTV